MTELIKGLDVSDVQNPESIDYKEARRQGFEWVCIKMSDGKDIDTACAAHVAKARDAGLTVGGYHFSN